MANRRYLIIGDGAAGMTAAQTVRQADPSGDILIVSDDPHPAYYRASLTNYLLGELCEEHLWAVPPTVYTEMRIGRRHARVAAVDGARSQVWLTSGGPPLTYEALMIGAGSRARHPSFQGADLPGVGTMRTLQDVRWVMDLIHLRALRRAVVIGGGPLALEWAYAMKTRGVEVTLMVRDTALMAGALDPVASDLLIARIRRGGIDLRLGDEVTGAAPGPNGQVGGVYTKIGASIPCEIVAAAIGVICNTEFLQGSGVQIGKRKGIIVDKHMRTSVANIFAGGDIVEFDGKLDQKWEPARVHGRIAGANMAGGNRAFAPGVPYFATRLFDLDYSSVGDVVPRDASYEEIAENVRRTGRINYRKVIVKNGKLVGALMLGEREERVRLRGKLYERLIASGHDVTAIKGDLLDPGFDLHGWLRTKEIVSKPVPLSAPASIRAGGKVPSAAAMRGTQALNLAEIEAMAAAGGGGGARAPVQSPAAMKGTQAINVGRDSAFAGPSVPIAALAAAAQRPVPPAPPPPGAHPQPGAPAPGAPPVPMQPYAPPEPGTMLSIGLRMPSHLVSQGGAAFPPAFLEGAGRRWDISAAVLSIGRDPSCPVVLNDPEVSHVHAQITRHGQDLYLRDLGSRNGTWVNGMPITIPHQLRHGDSIRIGLTTLMFGSAQGAAAPAKPRPAYSAFYGQYAGPAQGAAGAAGGQPVLTVQSGRAFGLSFALNGQTVTLGREPSNSVRLDDLTVSRKHAVMSFNGGAWYICDLQSATGTRRNGDRLPPGQHVPVVVGDLLQLGETALRFEIRQG